MLHTKSHGNWSTGSKEDFKAFLLYIDKEAIWPCDQHYIHIFISLYLKAYLQNLVKKGQVVSEKNMF